MRYKTSNVVEAVSMAPLADDLREKNLHNRLKGHIIEHLETLGEYCTPKQIQQAIEKGGDKLKAEL